MLTTNYSQLKTNLKNYVDKVENNNETLVIKGGKGTVIISLDEYNSIMETLHLLGTKANADRLYESMEQMNSKG